MNWVRIGMVVMSVLPKAISAVERLRGTGGGAEKKAAAKELVIGVLDGVEEAAGRDILNDDEVGKAYDAVIDAVVHFQNIVAKKTAQAPGAAND